MTEKSQFTFLPQITENEMGWAGSMNIIYRKVPTQIRLEDLEERGQLEDLDMDKIIKL